MRRALITLLTIGLGTWLLAAGQAFAAAPEHADVRVLIDISGSMKQNDPQNLRRPALRMLVGLMQPGTKAGVWTFAKYAGELVAPGAVDQAWKDKALKASEEITSPGMFTNIELVLQKAMHDWEGVEVTHRRHLVLLTDGVVDVSKVPGESESSRARILQDLLPKLKDMQVQLHTVALSERADHELLKELSKATGGWYEQVDSAEQLSRVFLKLFEKAGKPDGLPLKDNKFLVDNTIREATLLVFRKAGSAEPVLNAPSGQRFTREQAPDFVSWHQDTGYDLITLRDPEAGEWSIESDMDPDNRVMVVTDLKLHVSDLPTRIAAGEPMPVSAHLSNDGRLITRRDFLDIVEVRAETIGQQGLTPQPINDKGYKGDATAGDGKYGMNLIETKAQDEVELVIAAESPTFLREARHVMAVVEPAQLDVFKKDGVLYARLQVDPVVMHPDGVKVSLWQADPDGIRLPLEAKQQADGSYLAELLDTEWGVYARVQGVTQLGGSLSRQLGPAFESGKMPVVEEKPVEAEPEAQAAAESEPVAEPVPEPEKTEPEKPAAEQKPALEPEAQEAPAEEESWVLPAIGFGVTNLLLVIGGVVFWWLRRRNATDDDLTLVDEEEGDADGVGASSEETEK